MMKKTGLTSEEIVNLPVIQASEVEWLREVAWQLAKLREQLEQSVLGPK